jgi:hypothetical protein
MVLTTYPDGGKFKSSYRFIKVSICLLNDGVYKGKEFRKKSDENDKIPIEANSLPKKKKNYGKINKASAINSLGMFCTACAKSYPFTAALAGSRVQR